MLRSSFQTILEDLFTKRYMAADANNLQMGLIAEENGKMNRKEQGIGMGMKSPIETTAYTLFDGVSSSYNASYDQIGNTGVMCGNVTCERCASDGNSTYCLPNRAYYLPDNEDMNRYGHCEFLFLLILILILILVVSN